MRTFPAWIREWQSRRRERWDLICEHVALQHQVQILRRSGTRRPRPTPWNRLFWVTLSRVWSRWRRSLIIVQPGTVLKWRRQGLRLVYGRRHDGRWRGGRPRVDAEIRELIAQMARVNLLWGAPRIHGELLKLGFTVSEATVSRYLRKFPRPRSQQWTIFIRNHLLLDPAGFGSGQEYMQHPGQKQFSHVAKSKCQSLEQGPLMCPVFGLPEARINDLHPMGWQEKGRQHSRSSGQYLRLRPTTDATRHRTGVAQIRALPRSLVQPNSHSV